MGNKTYGFKIGKHIIDIKSKDEQSAFIMLGKKCWDFISNNEKVELLGELKPYIANANIEISEEEILNMIRQNHVVEDRIFGCSNKVKFSLNKAKMKAQQYGQSYYKCNHCGYYHLTKQNTYDSIMKQESENEK